MVFQVGTNRLKVFALRGFGVTCHESRRWRRIGPWPSPGTTVSEGGRSAGAWLAERSRACKVRAEAELSEVLKLSGSLSRGRLSRGLPGAPAHWRQGPKSRGSGSCGSQRPQETGGSPSGISLWAPPQVTLGTRLSLTGIGELACPSGLSRMGCASHSGTGEREPIPFPAWSVGPGSQGAGVGVVYSGRAPLFLVDHLRSSLFSSSPIPDGAPLLWLSRGQQAAPRLETAGSRLSAPTEPWRQSQPHPHITSCWGQTLPPPRSNCARGDVGSEVRARRETTSCSRLLVRAEAGSAA